MSSPTTEQGLASPAPACWTATTPCCAPLSTSEQQDQSSASKGHAVEKGREMGGTGIGGAGHLREGESGEDVGEGGGLVHGGVFNILKALCKLFS